MDRIDPVEPIERIDPADPMDRIDPAEPMDKREPTEPIDRADPTQLTLRQLATDALDRADHRDPRPLPERARSRLMPMRRP